MQRYYFAVLVMKSCNYMKTDILKWNIHKLGFSKATYALELIPIKNLSLQPNMLVVDVEKFVSKTTGNLLESTVGLQL